MKVVIIGGKGTAIVIADQIYDAHTRFGADIEVLGLALDDRSGGDTICGYPILCDIKKLHCEYGKYNDVFYIYSLYRPDVIEARSALLYSLDIPKEKFCNFIHPSVMLAKSATLGYGNVLLANLVVNSGVQIGNFNTFNSGVLIGHDTVIGNNNFIAAQVCVGSGVTIGNMNFVGLNSTVRNGLHIGDANIVGMASNVTKDIDNGCVLYGNPAKQKLGLNHVIR